LLTPDNVLTFDSNHKSYIPVTKDILVFFQYFYNWDSNKQQLKQLELMNKGNKALAKKFIYKIEESETLEEFFRTLKDECSLGLFLVFANEDDIISRKTFPEQDQDNYRKLKFLMEVLKFSDPKSYDIHLLTKALYIVRKYHCRNWRSKKLLFFSGILELLKNIYALVEMTTTREASELCSRIL